MFLKLRLKIRNFFKDHKRTIIIIFLVWLLIFAINFILSLRKEEKTLSSTFEPAVSIVDSKTVPEKDHSLITDVVDKYMNYCNNGEYENAYNMLSENCKNKAFKGDIKKFEEYIKSIFTQKKRYSLQSYSNYDDKHIYLLKIFNDYLATGLTGEEFATFDEKLLMVKEGDEYKLNIGDFIDVVDLKRVVEDDYSKIRILSKAVFCDHAEYLVKITNKTDYTMVISSVYEGNEVILDVGNDKRPMTNLSTEIVLAPGETQEYTLNFDKYIESKQEAQALIFNKIRILQSYTGNEEDAEKEKENAIKLYSLTIPLV